MHNGVHITSVTATSCSSQCMVFIFSSSSSTIFKAASDIDTRFESFLGSRLGNFGACGQCVTFFLVYSLEALFFESRSLVTLSSRLLEILRFFLERSPGWDDSLWGGVVEFAGEAAGAPND